MFMMQWFFEPHWSSPWTWYLTPGPETAGRVLTKISENKRADDVPHALSPSPHPNCYWKYTEYTCYTYISTRNRIEMLTFQIVYD